MHDSTPILPGGIGHIIPPAYKNGGAKDPEVLPSLVLQGPLLPRLPYFGCLADLDEAARGNVVNVPVDRNMFRNQRVGLNPRHISHHALGLVANRQPLDEMTFV